MVSPVVAATIGGSSGSALPAISSVAGPVLGAVSSLFGGKKFSAYDHWQGLENQYQSWLQQYNYAQEHDYYQRQRYMDQDIWQQQRSTQEQFKWLVDGAQRAGFNPLTVLGAGGARSANATPAISSPLAGGMDGSGFTRESGVGRAIGAAAAIADAFDPIERESRRLENELAKARLDQINSEQTRLGIGVPKVRTTSSNVETQSGNPTERDPHLGFEEGRKTVNIFGYEVPAYMADMYEQAGGNVLGEIATLSEFAKVVKDAERSDPDRKGTWWNYAVRMLTNPSQLNAERLQEYIDLSLEAERQPVQGPIPPGLRFTPHPMP